MSYGGLPPRAKDADDTVHKLVETLEDDIRKATGRYGAEFKAQSYKTQVVNGTNYFVKVNSGKFFYHVRIYQPFSGEPSVHSVDSFPHTAFSPIMYFPRPKGGRGGGGSGPKPVRTLPGGVGKSSGRVPNEVCLSVAAVETAILRKLGLATGKVEPLAYRSQLVNGTNYFVKCLVTDKNGEQSYALVRVYRSFRGDVELAGVRNDATVNSPIDPFHGDHIVGKKKVEETPAPSSPVVQTESKEPEQKPPTTIVGGPSNVKQPDEDAVKIVEALTPAIRKALGDSDQVTYKVCGIQTQVVAGINYTMYLESSTGVRSIAKIFRSLQNVATLTGAEVAK